MVITSSIRKVWSRLERKKKDGSTVILRFQELPPERTKEAMDLIIKYILRDEVIHRAIGIYKNAEATLEYRTVMNKMFELNPPHITICCVDDGSELGGELAGISKIAFKDESGSCADFFKLFKINTKEMEKFVKAVLVLENPKDLKEKYPRHTFGKGIAVHPDYRGMGIATEFIRIRNLICKEHNVPMSTSLMTAIGSQRAAEANGWKLFEIVYPKDISVKTGIEFEEGTPPFKRMYNVHDK
ncbi:uncharacterized protein LOC121732677 [Aricia agestis]|uniref:uncharacterized protein LOC121732677 n=1 Tax=Aricia agestis TaxID=91739 RepID=UPI001C206EB1|nr:uncharacterized protein LOC121732677 [Aricia agestis]